MESSDRDHSACPIRVLVVEDSPTVRSYIVSALESDPGLLVVGDAGNGNQAMQMCERLRPDVITLDMVLPGTSGLEVTEYVMAYCPTPILIVSASTNRRELFCTYDALAAGAVDVLEKPRVDVPDDAWREELLAKVRLVSRIPVITHLRGKRRPLGSCDSGPHPQVDLKLLDKAPRVVAIGASTGGPPAILEILGSLSPDFDLPILFVLHLSRAFGAAFADWLAGHVNIPVGYACHGMPLPAPGATTVLMAPPDLHLRVEGGRLKLSNGPERHSCRPSIDVLFESLAREMGSEVIACLLTGMGKDGAAGLAEIRRAGGSTLVQDEATSVVFGMPGEAIRMGAAQRVLPLSRLADAICALAGTREPERRGP